MERRLVICLPNGLKKALETYAKENGCSQAEIIRSLLYKYLLYPINDDIESYRKQVAEYLEGIKNAKIL